MRNGPTAEGRGETLPGVYAFSNINTLIECKDSFMTIWKRRGKPYVFAIALEGLLFDASRGKTLIFREAVPKEKIALMEFPLDEWLASPMIYTAWSHFVRSPSGDVITRHPVSIET